MIYKCKVNAVSFGFVETLSSGVNLEKDKDYTIEKDFDDIAQSDYYKVIDNDKVITTISESEFKLFFE